MPVQKLGTAAAAIWLVGMFVLVLAMPRLDFEYLSFENKPLREIMQTQNEKLREDQIKSREVSKVARSLVPRQKILAEQLEKIPPRAQDPQGHLTEEDYQAYLVALDTFTRGMKKFTGATEGTKGPFQTLAIIGMIGMLYDSLEAEGMIAAGVNREDFDWIMRSLQECAIYCLEYNLNNRDLSPEEREKHKFQRQKMLMHIGVMKYTDDGPAVIHPELYRPLLIPRHNLELFLRKNAERPFRYYHVDFYRIEFDAEAIMASAANNPP